MSTLRDNINDITLYINDRKAVKMNVFSLFYSVLILDISLMVSPVVQTVSPCGEKSPVAYFCTNTNTSGSSVFLDNFSKVQTFTEVSCRCDLRAPGDFYLASFEPPHIDMSDMITVNGKSIKGMVGNSSIRFQSMSSITFSANTENGIPGCIGISAVNHSTVITAYCLTHGASNGNDTPPKTTTEGNSPVTSQKPHDTDGITGDNTKNTNTDTDSVPGTEPASEQEDVDNGGNIGIIIGAAGGAIVVLAAVILAVVCFYRKRRSDQNRKQPTKAKQPEEDMTECAMYSSADDDQEKGAKEMAADGSKYPTEPEYSYSTVKVPGGETNNGYEDGEEDYNHLHQKPPRKRTENVYTVANFKIETKENENETNNYNYSTVQKTRAGK